MNSMDYIELSGCERLLDNIVSSEVNTPWSENKEEKMAIVREFLLYRHKELKEQT